MDYIHIKEKKDIIKLGIIDENNNIVLNSDGTEVCIEFDIGDIELPLKYNKCINDINNAKKDLKTQIFLIDKKKDFKKKNELLSNNEKEKVKAIKKFYSDMEKAMDLFLGQGGTKKFLNGKKPYWEMFDDLSEAIEPFLPKLKVSTTDMVNRIKEKYKIKESDVLTDE